jgi:hypothetical protein
MNCRVDEKFTTYESSMEAISKLTYNEMKTFLHRVYLSSLVRDIQHTEITDMAIGDAINIYLKRNPITITGEVKNVTSRYICDKGSLPNELPYILLKFDYGESDRESDEDIDTEFKVKIEQVVDPIHNVTQKELTIIITPPLYIISELEGIDMDMTKGRYYYDEKERIVENSKIYYSIGNKITFKKGPNAKKRKDMYGDLPKIMLHYLKDHATHLIALTRRLTENYRTYHISTAKTATYSFLIIGRFYKIYNLDIPYDIVKLIAKLVWDSRYDNELWRNIECRFDHYDEKHHMEVQEDYSCMKWYEHPNILPDFKGRYFQREQYFA